VADRVKEGVELALQIEGRTIVRCLFVDIGSSPPIDPQSIEGIDSTPTGTRVGMSDVDAFADQISRGPDAGIRSGYDRDRFCVEAEDRTQARLGPPFLPVGQAIDRLELDVCLGERVAVRR
jgi:hypothetical protein